MENASPLRLISRVGIGLDSVDLLAARELGIMVSYTPDAPSPAVAELTIGLMVSLLRGIPLADRNMRNGVWYRIFGRRIAECTIGVIGVGRVGKRVVRHLSGFAPRRILANDLAPDVDFGYQYNLEWTDKETIYREADIVTLHVPLTYLTHDLITHREIDLMKPTTVLINTARGGIVNERDLANALRSRQIAAAAIDTYLQEPYSGELTTLENCVLTSHMGSMSVDCRFQMELAATEDAIRFLRHEPLQGLVPESEYELRMQSR
jgi:D-3-phosphoglycerate dehydrogenase